MTLYGRALAHVHDDGFGFIARAAAASLVERLRARDVSAGLVVDLGCGSGIAARILIDAGYDVHGVDQSADLIALARERAPEAAFDHASLHDATLPGGAVAVTAMGEVLCYAGVTGKLLARVRGSLRSGGIFVFDVATPEREGTEPRRSWHEGPGWLLCAEARRQPDARRLTRRIAAFTRADGSTWSRDDEVHELELHEPAALVESLTAAGFEDARVDEDGYGPAVAIGGLAVIVGRAP